ncbi:MAG: hypothetical protein MRERV_3c096 [Mycoplasmataceae bacterium RV_VA103A]|nr:MAG: hypothetical protein MRERV_3c096 [Mycoplasmataceae bacterium RV_VA103A]
MTNAENINLNLVKKLQKDFGCTGKNCSFCQTPLKIDKNGYLKNRYKCKFWNNQPDDDRLICYICLKYSWQKNLPIISEERYKRQIFRKYEKAGMFKD